MVKEGETFPTSSSQKISHCPMIYYSSWEEKAMHTNSSFPLKANSSYPFCWVNDMGGNGLIFLPLFHLPNKKDYCWFQREAALCVHSLFLLDKKITNIRLPSSCIFNCCNCCLKKKKQTYRSVYNRFVQRHIGAAATLPGVRKKLPWIHSAQVRIVLLII